MIIRIAIGALAVAALVLVVPFIQAFGGDPFSRPDSDMDFSIQALMLSDGGVQRDIAHHGYKVPSGTLYPMPCPALSATAKPIRRRI